MACVGFQKLTLPLLIGLSATSCSKQADDCSYTMTCASPDGGDAGGTGHTAGGSGTNGAHSGGGRVGGNNSGGGNVGGSNMGGSATGGITSVCSPTCSGGKPVCNESARACVECIGDANCSGATPACNTTANTCVACMRDGNCSGTTPVCDTSEHACVQCLADNNCSGAKPACKTATATDAGTGTGSGTNTCVQCTKDSHCSGNTPLCDSSANLCVQCKSNADCTKPEASLCTSGSCGPCSQDSDCARISGKTVCNTAASTNPDAGTDPDAGTGTGSGTNTCVQCTGTKYTACEGDAGTPQVCDSLNNTCTDKAEHSADLCQPCVSDAQCKLGELCVEQKVNGNSLGYFCFWKQGDTANSAPAVCGDTGRPYVSAVSAISIDAEPATICSLRASTCTAMNQYSQTSCASPTNTPTAPDDNLCGALPGVDSKCVAVGSTQYRCTVACGSDDDCPIIGVTPITCSITAGTRKYCSL